ncbi:hypothetical protein ACQY0O_003451 [Thecaphora frezii]
MSTQATPNTQPVKTKSKAYSSTVAIQGDAAKYRLKYKELKKKVREIETENEKLHFKTLRIKRNIQRMRLERAILYERLESETAPTSYRAPSQHHYDDRYPPSHHSQSGAPTGGPPSYAPSYAPPPHASRSGGYDARDYRYGAAAPTSRGTSPPPPPLAAAAPGSARAELAAERSGVADRSSALRQYTPSVSPEESREMAPPTLHSDADGAGKGGPQRKGNGAHVE